MTPRRADRRWSHTAASIGALALLAYVPALLSSPGRMPADTKLYLYLDPGGLVGRASSTFEPDQFAGWVPHQQITYLWPSGPWFWLFDALAVPDWIAHRLWIATLMFAAGTGVRWMVRRIGLTGAAALAAAIAYQLSPFLLPYISRTSVLLLPWAGLGWIVGLVIVAGARLAQHDDDRAPAPDGEATWRRRLLPWREPVLVALVVVTVGSANATALALIVPAPVLWLVHAAWSGSIRWRAAVAVAARTAATCLVASLWWVAMLVVQSSHGAPVLSYSETLADVSRNSTGSEVLRSLGYWLFYVRDPFGPTTTSSFDHLVSTRLLVVGYAVVLVGLAGIALTTFAGRRFAAMLAFVGVVLSVGVHPIDSPSPLMSLVATDDESGIALALRSSTRALPLFALALAIGIGAVVAAVPTRAVRRPSMPTARTVAAVAAVAIVLLNLPSLWRFELVDPAIDRDQDPPAAWRDAARELDDTAADVPARVLQLPGAEFGAFRWGYTVDQPLVGLSDRKLVTRDLLPLGEAGAMDLLYALDDRFQEGTVEVASVAPVARLLGADTVWLANDAEYERFRTPRPEIVADLLGSGAVDGLEPPRAFGPAEPSVPTVPMVDPVSLSDDRVGEPLAPVALIGVDEPVGVARAKTGAVIVAGSGDGLVDAAAAGLLSGHELVRYSASLDGVERHAAIDAGTPVVVTDSNRDRAHHWRGSQDVHGHTEPGGPDDDVLVRTNADQRLAVFPTDDPALQTVAVQIGPVRAIASSYGEPFAYLPEHRAAMAIDGDPATAWLVGGHGDPVGERIRLDLTEPATDLTLRQPVPAPGGRRIDSIELRADGGPRRVVDLTDESLSPAGQRVEVDTIADVVEIEIRSVTAGDPARAASRAAVGFVEVDLGLGPTTEVIRPPELALASVGDGPLAIALTRLRIDPLDRWRSDPERELHRRFTVAGTRTMEGRVTLRLDRRAADPVIAALAGITPPSSATADRRLTGAASHGGPSAVDGDETTAWITPIDGAIGSTLVLPSDGTATELTLVQPGGADLDTITAITVADGRASFDLAVPEPDAGGMSRIELPGPIGDGPVTVTITGVSGRTTVDRRFGDVVTLPAAIAEIDLAGVSAVPLDRDAVVTEDCRDDLLELDGRPVPLSFSTTLGALLDGAGVEATVCGGPLELGGDHDLRSVGRPAGLTVDRVVLTDGLDATSPGDRVPVRVERDDARDREYAVGPCPDGCWLVHGEGFNDAWSASADGRSLGPPEMVDGGFNGWWIEPTDEPVEVGVRWTAQRPVTIGLAASLAAVLAGLAIVVLTWRDRAAPEPTATPPRFGWSRPLDPVRHAVVTGGVLAVGAGVLIAPVWAIAGLIVGGVAALGGRTVAHPLAGRVFELAGLAIAGTVALAVVVIVRRDRPLPTAGWTESVAHLNGAALFAVACLTAGALLPGRRRP